MKSKKGIILISLMVSVLLLLIKFTAYFITQSNAILTDAAESIVNVIAVSFAFYSIHLSSLPKDENHPYGHGKVEFFSAFLEGVLIALAGAVIFGKAIYNIFYPEELKELLSGAGLVAVTGVINGALGYYMKVQGKSQKSITIEADGKHLLSDAWSSFALVVGIFLIWLTGYAWLDILISIGLSIFIVFSGYKLIRVSVGGLMDESDVEVVQQVVDILELNKQPDWIDIHNLRIQRYGEFVHIDCHVTLPYYYDLVKAHKVVSSIDHRINSELVSTEFFIHSDPCLPQCCHYCNMPNCFVRKEPKSKDIVWTVQNVTKNMKHFEQEG